VGPGGEEVFDVHLSAKHISGAASGGPPRLLEAPRTWHVPSCSGADRLVARVDEREGGVFWTQREAEGIPPKGDP